MPELPEVETTCRQIKAKVLERAFLDVWTDFPKMIKRPKSFDEFKKRIKNKKIKKIWRAGKNIIFDLSDNFSLLIHQKLTGHLLYGKWQKTNSQWQAKIPGPLREDRLNKYLHLIFFLDNGFQMALSDLRKFAKVELTSRGEIKKELSSLGPDPLEIDFDDFKERLLGEKGKAPRQARIPHAFVSAIASASMASIKHKMRKRFR